MFGDKLLAGQFEVSVDKKCRIFLPAKTGREKGDSVYIAYDDAMEYFKLYGSAAIQEVFSHYDQLVLEAKTPEERLYYKREGYKFCKSILKEAAVDTQGRMSLNSIVEPDEKVTLIGAGNHMILERKKNNNK
jgi:DNA-binding transcriptional regulator/RsmH inhibitor MraZ